MNAVIHPEPFSEFFGLWFFYVISWGLILSFFFFIIGTIGLTLFAATTKQLSCLPVWLVRFGGFLAVLLPIGGLFNAFWCCLVSGNLYYAQDVDSPEDDFSPFWPIDSTWLNEQHGHAMVSVWQLQLVWLGFAAIAWLMSYWIYKTLAHYRPWQIRIPFVQA
jgi:hypothetical protein